MYQMFTGFDKKKIKRKIVNIFLPISLNILFGLIGTVLLSTQNIREIRKIFFVINSKGLNVCWMKNVHFHKKCLRILTFHVNYVLIFYHEMLIILEGSTQINVPWNWLVHVKGVRIIDGYFIDVNPIGN